MASGRDETPADLRRRAARVYQLAREVTNEQDAARLRALAADLEQRAARMEAENPQ